MKRQNADGITRVQTPCHIPLKGFCTGCLASKTGILHFFTFFSIFYAFGAPNTPILRNSHA
ncbi:MAG: hypothetical protein Q4E16_05265 [Neisseria sp.]|nr:hypothetical protein [Neisseria sp.]